MGTKIDARMLGGHAGSVEEERLPRRRANPVLLLSATLALAFTVVIVLQEDDLTGGLHEPDVAPALFDGVSACDAARASAAYRGMELERKAFAKNERAPWNPQDGVEAALRLSQASACFALAGDAPRAAETSAQLTRWQRKLVAEYQRTRLQLEFTLRKARDATAKEGRVTSAIAGEIAVHVRTLKGLLAHRDGPYLQWLEGVARRYAQTKESKR